jgi:hypothetical protein
MVGTPNVAASLGNTARAFHHQLTARRSPLTYIAASPAGGTCAHPEGAARRAYRPPFASSRMDDEVV